MIGNFFYSSTGAAAAYEIEQSLRFDGSGTGFPPVGGFLGQDNPSSGGSTTQWTCSFWAKRGNSGSVKVLMSSIYQPNNNEAFGIQFTANDTLLWNLYSAITFETSQVFRDYSAWYHIVLVWDSANATAAHRCRLYVNGEEVTTWTTRNDPALNAGNPWCQNGPVPGGSQNLIGYQRAIGALAWYQSLPYNGYMAEFHCVQGQALDANDFGEFNDDGVWVPKKYAGTYSGNSFYLKFDAADVDGDSSGLGNDWTASGFTTSGTGTDVMDDTPTTNWCTLNPLSTKSMTLSNGNLDVTSTTTSDRICKASFVVKNNTADKWYWEVTNTTISAEGLSLGICSPDAVYSGGTLSSGRDFLYANDGDYILDGSGFGPGWWDTFTSNDVIGVALTFNSSGDPLMEFFVNGVGQRDQAINAQGQTEWVPCWTTFGGTNNATFNFGQRAFEYTPPTGFNALNTANLPAPDIADGSDYFNTVLWTGDGFGSSRTISGVGFQPGFVWTKSRTETWQHLIYDSVRGAGNESELASSNIAAEGGVNANLYGYLSAFTSDGMTFTSGTDGTADQSGYYNKGGQTYVAWNWLAANGTSSNTDGSITSTVSANPTAGFSIVSYTGTGIQGSTIGHGLGVAPKLIIAKVRSTTNDWVVYHASEGAGKYGYLNTTDAFGSSNNFWGNGASAVEPTSSVFTIGSNARLNSNTQTFIAYCFAEVEGYSKFGSYTGNGSTDGPFVYTGFRPKWLLIKCSSTLTNWYLLDSTRNTYNVTNSLLRPNIPDAEISAVPVDFLSNGFKLRDADGGSNASGSTYIYAAFAEHPFGGDGVSPATAR
jgi:hypothetical protein